MKKLLLLLLLSTNVLAQGDPAPYVKGQKSTGLGNQASTIFVPSNQSTKINAYQALLETGNPNMLVNPEFEGSVSSGWTCATGTCTKTTTSGEFSSGLAAMKIVPAANVLNVSQSVNTPAGIQAQGYARILYRVPSTCSTSFVIRTLVNGSTQSEVPTNRLVFDDKFHEIEIPLVFSTTSAGIQVFASGTCTGNIFIDSAVVAQGLGTQNLMLDNTYSAQISSAGTVSLENTDWISGNCTNANPTVCTIKSGLVSSIMNCTATPITPNDRFATIDVNTGDFSVWTKDSTGAASSVAVKVICQKSGNDYLNSSANVYASQNATTVTTKANKTSVQNITSAAFATNTVLFNNVDFDTTSSYAPGTGLYTAPETGYYSVSAGVTFSANGAGARLVDVYVAGIRKTTIDYVNEPSAGAPYLAKGTTTVYALKGETININAWQNSGSTLTLGADGSSFNYFSVERVQGGATVVGSFAGVPAVPGYQGIVETFSVSYGTTNATTACSASPCSYLDQIGTGVSSITRAAGGSYSLVASKTYAKLKCTISAYANGVATASVDPGGIQCTNCSSVAFLTRRTDTAAQIDTTGVIICQGTY